MSKKPFYVEGMTVEEIVNLGDDVLNKMNARDLSRALRTVALAANKRINRLKKHADIKVNDQGDVKYIEKGTKGIDFEALYRTGGEKFGLGRGKHQRGEIYKEFARVRNFINAPSSTVTGAIALRQQRERQLFGKTREEFKEGFTGTQEELNALMSDIYAEYHRWREEYAIEGGYSKEQGRRVLKMFGRRVLNKGMTPEDARTEIENYYDEKYEKEEYKRLNHED